MEELVAASSSRSSAWVRLRSRAPETMFRRGADGGTTACVGPPGSDREGSRAFDPSRARPCSARRSRVHPELRRRPRGRARSPSPPRSGHLRRCRAHSSRLPVAGLRNAHRRGHRSVPRRFSRAPVDPAPCRPKRAPAPTFGPAPLSPAKAGSAALGLETRTGADPFDPRPPSLHSRCVEAAPRSSPSTRARARIPRGPAPSVASVTRRRACPCPRRPRRDPRRRRRRRRRPRPRSPPRPLRPRSS